MIKLGNLMSKLLEVHSFSSIYASPESNQQCRVWIFLWILRAIAANGGCKGIGLHELKSVDNLFLFCRRKMEDLIRLQYPYCMQRLQRQMFYWRMRWMERCEYMHFTLAYIRLIALDIIGSYQVLVNRCPCLHLGKCPSSWSVVACL